MGCHFNFNELHVAAAHSSCGASGGKLLVWHLIVDEYGPCPMVFTARIRILECKVDEAVVDRDSLTCMQCQVILRQWCIQ
jgi:hypothetical protein